MGKKEEILSKKNPNPMASCAGLCEQGDGPNRLGARKGYPRQLKEGVGKFREESLLSESLCKRPVMGGETGVPKGCWGWPAQWWGKS